MSDTTRLPVVEWSNTEVRAFDPVSGKTTIGKTVSDVAAPLRGRAVMLALSRRSSFVRSTRLPDVGKPEMAKILALQVGSLFPIETGDASVDFLPLEDRNADGRLAVVAAVRTDVLREALAELEGAGLKVAKVVPTALSSMTNGTVNGAIVSMTSEGLAIDLLSQGGLRTSRVTGRDTDPTTIHAEVGRTFASVGMEPGTVATSRDFNVTGIKNSEIDPLAALSSSTFDVNLELPEKKAKRASALAQRSRNLALLLWCAAILAGVIVFNARYDAQQAVAKEEARWSARLTSLRALEQKTKVVSDLAQKQRDLIKLSFEPAQPLGDAVSVVASLAPPKLWLTGITVERGKTLTLRGTSLSSQAVTAFLASLSKQSRFRDAKLVFTNNGMIEKTPVVNFSMTAHIVGNFPLPVEQRGSK